MKTRNTDLEHSSLLTNHIFKHIVLEAPTALELQKKVKEYELILVKALTNAYRLSHLILENDGTYHISPTGSYQVPIIMTFDGKKKDEIANPDKTLQYVKQLTALESKKHHESKVITSPKNLIKEIFHTESLTIEVEDKTQLDEKISSKQKELLERLITDSNLIEISFLTTVKHKDSQTGKLTISIKAQYTCRKRLINKAEHADIDNSGNR